MSRQALRTRCGSRARCGWNLRSVLLLCLGPLAGSCDERIPAVDVLYFDLTAHRFTAERRFLAHDPRLPSEYTEELISTGDGNWRLRPLTLRGKARAEMKDPAMIREFDLLAEQMAEGGGFRVLHQRDFRIEDLELLRRNYRVILDPAAPPVAPCGDSCLSYWITSYFDERPFYYVTVSTEDGREGMPLGFVEYRIESGIPQPMFEMSVLALQYGQAEAIPPHSNQVFSRRAVSLQKAKESAGFPLLVPSQVPEGFRLVAVEEVTMRTDATADRMPIALPMIRMVVSDGVARIDVIQHRPLEHGLEGRSGTGSEQLQVHVATFGSASIAHVLGGNTEVVVESRISMERFHSVLKGLIPLQ